MGGSKEICSGVVSDPRRKTRKHHKCDDPRSRIQGGGLCWVKSVGSIRSRDHDMCGGWRVESGEPGVGRYKVLEQRNKIEVGESLMRHRTVHRGSCSKTT